MAADPRLGNTGSAHDGAGTCTYDSLDIWTLEYFTGSRFYGYVRLDDYTMMGLRVGSWSSAFPLGCKFMEVHDGRLSQLFDSVIAMKFNSFSFHAMHPNLRVTAMSDDPFPGVEARRLP